MLWIFCFNFFSGMVAYSLLFSNNLWILEGLFFSVSTVEFSAVFIMDMYSLVFFFIVMLISSMIYFFSQYYMDGEKTMKIFYILLLFFILSMLFLIFSPNFLFLLMGWDGLGVTSYLLIVYYMNYSSSVAGMLTFMVNRLGDVFFFSSLAFFSLFLDWNFFENKITFTMIFLPMVLTFMTKSAQIPFSSWLPAAMSAPTPVSSLVHSSTLVTAGVYLLVRFSYLLSMGSKMLLGLAIMTILLAGIMANLDWDLKKIIAFSTLSQLGFMISSYACGLIFFCFFHLLTHALFKASLFMCSGVVIHSEDNSQDFRNNKGFLTIMPFLSSSIIICLLCLCGFPFSSGFFSKDLVLDGGLMGIWLFMMFFFSVILTFSYSLRFSYYLLNNKMISRVKLYSFSDNIIFICTPILILVVSALIFGVLWAEMMSGAIILLFVSSGWKSAYWMAVLFMVFLTDSMMKSFSSHIVKKYFLSSMWYLNMLISLFFFKIYFFFSMQVLRIMDHGWLENLGPSGIFMKATKNSFF